MSLEIRRHVPSYLDRISKTEDLADSKRGSDALSSEVVLITHNAHIVIHAH